MRVAVTARSEYSFEYSQAYEGSANGWLLPVRTSKNVVVAMLARSHDQA